MATGNKGACTSMLTLAVLPSMCTCVLVSTSILFFLFGYVCGRKSGKKISENVNQIIHENTMSGPELMDLTKNEAYDLLNTRGIGISQP